MLHADTASNPSPPSHAMSCIAMDYRIPLFPSFVAVTVTVKDVQTGTSGSDAVRSDCTMLYSISLHFVFDRF